MKGRIISCIFGQEFFGNNKKYTDYVSLGNGFLTVAIMAKNQKADAHNVNKGTSGTNKIRKSNMDNHSNQLNSNNKEFKGKK